MVSLIWTNRLEVAPAEEGELVPILNKTAATTDHSMQLFITRAQIFVPETQLLSDIKQGRSVDLSRMEDYNSTTKGIWEKNIHVIVLLRPQKFYLASDWAAAVIAFMIALSVGCCNDPILFRSQLQNRKPILAGLICQFIVLPIFTLGIGACFSLDADEAFGMFATVIVPGGGFGYLLTYLVHGDRHLSATLSLLASLVNIVMFPLWMYGVGWLWFNRCIHMGKAIGWLGFIASAQALGTFMRGCRPSVAHAILTWVTRPLLLLAGILMITLGVYIHHYAFNEMTQKLVLCLMLPITFGFATGWTAGRITGQEIPVIKTLATEASLFNGLICMPLLRTSLHAPEGDMSAVLSLWAVFLSPMSLAYHAIVSVVHRWLTDFLQRRRKEREQNTIGMIIGSGRGEGNIGEMGAASVAAVAAAAIAVAPAITAGPRSNDRSKTNKELEENRTTGVLNERFNVTATPQKSNGRRSASTTEYPPTPFKIKPTDEGHIDENCYHTIGAEMTSLEARLLPHPSTSEGLRENQYLTTNYLYRQPKISRELGFELSEDCNVDPHLRSPRISDITGRHNLHQIKPHNTCTYETPKSIRQEELGYAYQPPRKPPGLHRSERHRPLPYTNL
ncbi:unnamed protein product [Calicophoron daubneyi]|uniref:Uncharacterized protein n=1 Tax=Calicophoron daubneyi TaxID=300641 RepID=A0AAV2T581_CALDB